MPPVDDPVAALSEAARRTAAQVESLSVELMALRTRLDALEQHETAIGGAIQQATDRTEALRSELGRITRVEAAITQLRDVVSREQTEHVRVFRTELAALGARLAVETQRLGQAATLQSNRIEALEGLPAKLDGIERERLALARALQALEARQDDEATERAAVLEEVRRAEQRLQARLEPLQAQIREQDTELGQWRALIESQSETVREARAVADHMREEVAGIRQDQHSVAETERMFEQRVEGTLTAARREAADAWERFHRERAADWALLKDANSARDARDSALAEALAAAVARLDVVEVALQQGLAERQAEVVAVRRDLAAALGGWRTAVAEATAIVESAVGLADTPAALDERRQALRRALRAQRAGREG